MEQDALDFYSEMTNYELAELQNSIWSGLSGNFSIFISILFAYLLLSYFEGKRLSRFQLASVTGIYSVFQLFMLGFMSDGFRKVLEVETMMSGREGAFVSYIFLSVLFLSWVVSIIFMRETRRNI